MFFGHLDPCSSIKISEFKAITSYFCNTELSSISLKTSFWEAMSVEATPESKLRFWTRSFYSLARMTNHFFICPILPYFMLSLQVDKLFSPTSKSIGLVVHERFYVLPLKEYQLDFDNLEKLNRLQESFIPKYLNLDMSKQRFLINPSNKIPTLGEIKILEEIAYADFKYK